MRLSINACKGCNQQIPIEPSGHHFFQDDPEMTGNYVRCAFIKGRASELHENERFDRFYHDKKVATRRATLMNGAILAIGDSPYRWIYAVVVRGRK